jgi:hypothetical protein
MCQSFLTKANANHYLLHCISLNLSCEFTALSRSRVTNEVDYARINVTELCSNTFLWPMTEQFLVKFSRGLFFQVHCGLNVLTATVLRPNSSFNAANSTLKEMI